MAHFKRILIVKTSSLGDVIHMLPAVTDARRRYPDLQVDWLVEESFAEVPQWHHGVNEVFTVAIRRWRKKLFSHPVKQEIRALKQRLQQSEYDAIIDAQGLLKSAWVSCWAKGKRFGYDYTSAREPWASFFYQNHTAVDRKRHAVKRNRLLLANVLGYSIVDAPLNYGLNPRDYLLDSELGLPKRFIVGLHGTSREDKEWPESHWQRLAALLQSHQLALLLPWGNTREKARAERLAQANTNVHVLPASHLTALLAVLSAAKAVVGVDTGLMHAAAALGKPGVALYPVTQVKLTGVLRNDEARGVMEVLEGSCALDVDHVLDKVLLTIAN